MKFRFSLAPVLKVREHKEKLQKQRLAEKQRLRQVIADKKSEIAIGLRGFIEERDDDSVNDINRIRSSYAHMEYAHQIMGNLVRDLNRAEQDIDRERDKLIRVHRDTRIMEKAKEREHKVFLEEIDRQDRRQMDEIATQLYNRHSE
ncbi:MAG: flagellar FliJ family protein [Balneolales bacterium]